MVLQRTVHRHKGHTIICCRKLTGFAKKLTNAIKLKKKVRQIGDPILRKVAVPVERGFLVTPEFKNIVDEMTSTMKSNGICGISAPQLGYPFQMCAIEVTGNHLKHNFNTYGSAGVSKMEMSLFPLKVLINPKIRVTDSTIVSLRETCSSIEGYSAVVPRAKSIEVKALSVNAENECFAATGWIARLIQHEVDHLNGHLFIDSMLYKSFSNDKWRNYLS